jgi:hypothetical protein
MNRARMGPPHNLIRLRFQTVVTRNEKGGSGGPAVQIGPLEAVRVGGRRAVGSRPQCKD